MHIAAFLSVIISLVKIKKSLEFSVQWNELIELINYDHTTTQLVDSVKIIDVG